MKLGNKDRAARINIRGGFIPSLKRHAAHEEHPGACISPAFHISSIKAAEIKHFKGREQDGHGIIRKVRHMAFRESGVYQIHYQQKIREKIAMVKYPSDCSLGDDRCLHGLKAYEPAVLEALGSVIPEFADIDEII